MNSPKTTAVKKGEEVAEAPKEAFESLEGDAASAGLTPLEKS